MQPLLRSAHVLRTRLKPTHLITGCILAASLGVTSSFNPALAQYVVNAGDTVVVYSNPSTPYVINDPAGITINGMIRVLEKPDGGGAVTANGGILQLLSPGGFITIGSTGNIHAGAYIPNGTGGNVTLTAPTITVNGLIQANGLGTGGGGTINLNGTTINVGALGNIQARGAGTAGLGGDITMTGSGVVTLASGSIVSPVGVTSATKNLVTITGSGVNLDGIINAQANSVGNGGKIQVTSTSTGDNILISSTGRLQTQSNTGNGGTITLTGNSNINGGQLTANTGASSRNGGTITISGATNNNFTLQSNGIVNANGRVSGTNSRGGTINIATGSMTLDQGTIQADGSYTGGGGGGAISMTATGGTLNVNNGHKTQVLGDTGGSLTVATNNGNVNVNAGGWLRAQGDSTTTVNVTGQGITVGGTIEAGGWQDGDGGTLVLTSQGSGNHVTVNTKGILSAIGGNTAATDGGTISVTSAGNISLLGADNLGNINRPNDAHVRAYGIQVGGVGPLGNGGVINMNATGSYGANAYSTVNAKGTTVKSGSTYSKGVINITSGANADIDGITQVGGRLFTNGGGGAIRIQSGGNMTVYNTALLGATVSSLQPNATGDGGRIDLITTGSGANINLNGGSTVISGVARGFVDFSSGTTGDGGTLIVNAQNGSVFLSGANLIGDGAGGLGGIVNLIAKNTLSINSLSTVTTNGGTTSARNRIELSANTFSMTGTLNAVSTVGKGGYIKVTDSGANDNFSVNFTGGPTYNVAGLTEKGTLHFVGRKITTGQNLTHTDGTLILEATNGVANINKSLTAKHVQILSNGASGAIVLGSSGGGDIIRAVGASGAAGTITATSTSSLQLVNSTLLDATGGVAGAKGGTVSLTSTGSAIITDANTTIDVGGNIGGGTGGTVNLSARSSLLLGSDSFIYSRGRVTSNSYTGSGGNVNLTSTNGILSQGQRSIVDVSSYHTGQFQGAGNQNHGGNITISVKSNSIHSNFSELRANGATYSGASGSNIRGGNGGLIQITAPASIRFRNGTVASAQGGNGVGSNANGGTGGNVNMFTPSLQLTNTAQTHFLVGGGSGDGTGSDGADGGARNNNQLLF